jgi:hypothetical protein
MKILFEKLTVALLINKFSAFYRTRMFMTVMIADVWNVTPFT